MTGLVDEAFRRAEASATTRTKPVALAPTDYTAELGWYLLRRP